MAAHHPRGNATLPIRFFKIILKTNLQRIKIPNKFTKIYGGGLSNPMFIKPPDGKEWEVYWTKLEDGDVWLDKGWKEFVENYYLDQGYLVLFKYEGTSLFHVLILDHSALEIDYPSCDTCDGNESVEIVSQRPGQKARHKSPLFSPRSHRIRKTRGKKTTQRTSSLNRPREARAREVAENFVSHYPFFTVSITHDSLARYQLVVPVLKGYVEDKEKDVMLQIGRRSWKVKLLPCYGGNSSRRFSAGWNLFASESKLQAGDVCVFELINRKKLVFKVHVFE